MAAQKNNNQAVILEEALTRFVDECLQGEKPDIDEFAKQYPQYEIQLKKRIQDLKEIDFLFDTLIQADESEFNNTTDERDLVGKKVGSFEIKKIIGRGGMGTVYVAHDTRLDRSVAVKSMPAELQTSSTAQARFKREAKLLASLNHPNIAVIHDIIEEDKSGYLVLEYIPGQTLAERIAYKPLSLEETLSIGQQIAEAVAAAHEKGVIHRDLKPGNIKITPEGKVKVLDFGLAKVTTSEDRNIENTVTNPGRIMGTPSYMSPEQARGKETDHRTDIWSFGCIMYQMLTCQPPFEGETATDTLARIIERQPNWELLPNETPESIRALLRRCLEKNQDERLEDIADAAIEIKETLSKPVTPVRTLWWWAMATGFVVVAIVVGLNIGRRREQLPAETNPGHIKSLAVLPLKNLTGDPKQEDYSDGMTEVLIADLGKIGALRVISHRSVMQYKGSNKPLPEIARDLSADFIVEGSVLRATDQVRITVHLTNAEPERHIWADNYDRDSSDILILSSEVARTIAREIHVTLTTEEQARLASARPVNPEAYDVYVQGKQHYFKLTREGFEKAAECFHKAVEVDPNFAQAYAWLACSYGFRTWARYMPRDEGRSKAEEFTNKALDLDYTLAEAHFARSGFLFYIDWNWAEGIKEMKLALELNPNLAEGHREYANYLMAMGRFEESIAEAKLAFRLEPFVPSYEGTVARMQAFARKYDEVIAFRQRAIEADPNKSWPYRFIAQTYANMGKYDDAITNERKALFLDGKHDQAAALDRFCSEEGSKKGYWMWHLEQLEGRHENRPFRMAQIYAQLGDKDQAFDWLEKAYEQHNGWFYVLKVDPPLDPLRDDPRFTELLRRLNFPE